MENLTTGTLKTMWKNYSNEKFIMYLDANNLYGWALIQYLPTGHFKLSTRDEINSLDLSKFHEERSEGLILEVDLHDILPRITGTS